jgi:hypothetical protein
MSPATYVFKKHMIRKPFYLEAGSQEWVELAPPCPGAKE